MKKKKPKTQQMKGSSQFSASKARLNVFQQKWEKPKVEIEELGKNKDNFSYKTVREKEGKLIYREIHEPGLAAANMLHRVIYNSVYSSGS